MTSTFRTHRSRRRLVVLAGLASTIAALAPAAGAARPARDGAGHASDDRHAVARTWPVSFSYTEGEPTLDGADCHGLDNPAAADESTCAQYYKGEAHFTGSVVGTQAFNLRTWWTRDGRMHYEGVVRFAANVVGCGRGTFDVSEAGYVDYPNSDLVGGSSPGFNDWSVVPGSATGGLKGRLLAGSGVNHWREYSGNYGSGKDDFGRGTYTGTITCRVPND